MMNRLVCLWLVIQGLLVNIVTPENIPPVRIKRVISLDSLDYSGFILQWDPVKWLDQNDPIIGYKVKVWEAPCVTKTVRKLVNGTMVKEIIGYRKKFNPYAIPDETPLYVYIVPADELECTVPEILYGVWYHVRMLAFTRTEEGEHSDPHQFAMALNEVKDERCNSLNQTISSLTQKVNQK